MSSSFEFPELRVLDARAPDDARAAVEAEQAAALAEARAAGYADGVAAARAELAPVVQAFVSAAESLEVERARALESVERSAAELALALADKVIGTALEVRPELVVEVVRSALRRLADQREAAVLVNPDDLEAVRDSLETLSAATGLSLAVRGERRVPRGGCVLRTQDGEIDARVAEQLERARDVVAEALVQ